MIGFFLTSFVMFFVVVDPVALIPVFVALTEGDSADRRRAMASRAVLLASAILVLFLYGGSSVLRVLGISMPAFQIAGGVLLFLLAIDMVFARQSGLRSTTDGEHREGMARDDVSVFPLAFPLIAGPGAITTILLLAVKVQGSTVYSLGLLGVVLGVMAITLALLTAAVRVMAVFGQTGANVVSRILGLILAALATQYVIDGILGILSRSPNI